MDRDTVDSSMIITIGYESFSGTLEIEFRSSGQVWQYYDVPEATYNDLRSAGSLGKAFNSMIKGQFREARIG
jgi:hypothetical protein